MKQSALSNRYNTRYENERIEDHFIKLPALAQSSTSKMRTNNRSTSGKPLSDQTNEKT